MNECENCSDKIDSHLVADTGTCTKCGKVSDCWDHDLLAFYRQFEVTDHFIWSNLPRLLDPNLSSQRASMDKIGQILLSHLKLNTNSARENFLSTSLRQQTDVVLANANAKIFLK